MLWSGPSCRNLVQLRKHEVVVLSEERFEVAPVSVDLDVLVLVRLKVFAEGIHATQHLPRCHRKPSLLHELFADAPVNFQLLAVPAAPTLAFPCFSNST